MKCHQVGQKFVGSIFVMSALGLICSCGTSSDDWTETQPMPSEEIEVIYQQYEKDNLLIDKETYFWIHEPEFEVERLERLLQTPGGVNSIYSETQSTFLYGASTGSKKQPISAEVLINNGADVNIITNSGLTPLHVAALVCNVAVANLLLENGADVHATDQYGFTPLMKACQNGLNPHDRQEMVQLLIKWGANPKTYIPYEIWQQSTWPRTPYDGLKEQWEKYQDAEAKQIMDQWEAPPMLPQG